MTKRLILGIAILCVIIGLPLIVISVMSIKNGGYEKSGVFTFEKSREFKIPVGYKKIEVDLNKNDRQGETLSTISINKPSTIDFYIQTDSKAYKLLQFVSKKRLIGTKSDTFSLVEGNEAIVNSSNITYSFIVDSGNYNLVVSNKKASGKILVCYRIKALNGTDFERLKKIDGGDLDNPPEGYKKVFSGDLISKNSQNEIVYKFSLDNARTIGFSAYADVKGGNIDLRIKGKNYSSYLVSGNHYIRDQFYRSLGKGDYEISLSCNNADGELYVFMKK